MWCGVPRKPGVPFTPEQSRGILISTSNSTIIKQVLNKRVSLSVAKTSKPCQIGCRPGFGTELPSPASVEFLAMCKHQRRPAASLFADLKGAFYHALQEQIVGSCYSDAKARPAAAVTASGPGEAARISHAAAGTGGRAHGPTRGTPVRSEEGRKTIIEALDALSKGEEQIQEHMRGALAELRQWVATTATLRVPAPAAASAMTLISTTLDGLLSKFEFEGTEEVKLSAEEKLLLREACNKTKLE